MSKKVCNNTDYTKGFKITRTSIGTFIATKGKHKLTASSAKELQQLIENYKEE